MTSFTLLEYIGWSLCLFIALLSTICSIITLYLLKQMKKWNGYLQLVLNLTISQGIYDLSYFLLPFFYNSYCRVIFEFISTYGGISSTLWCNVIVFITCQIVISLRSVNILEQHRYYLFVISFISGILGIFDAIYLDNVTILATYFLIKTISMFLNIIFYFIIMYKVIYLLFITYY